MPSRLALLIGAYGGEHIGDMGILGGVTLRLADREKITHAVVASFRPERTRRLVSLINPAVPLEVAPSDLAAMRRSVRDADVLVWAGGPLGDWPRVLTRNLTTAVAARALGMPFVVEGASGFGASNDGQAGAWGFALLRLATSITVRSKGAASEVVRLAGRPAAVSRDPEFDYIANRSVSDLMTPHEEARIQELASRPATRGSFASTFGRLRDARRSRCFGRIETARDRHDRVRQNPSRSLRLLSAGDGD